MIAVRSLEPYISEWQADAESQWLLLCPDISTKNLLIQHLSGITLPSRGQIWLRDEEITALPEPARDALRADVFGIVFQSLRLIPSLTVLQNLEIARSMSGKAASDQPFDAALRALEIDRFKHSKPSALDSAQTQRAAIARAIVTDPKILLCDEPTAMLDEDAAAALIALLKKLCLYRKLTLVIVACDLRLQAQFAHCVSIGAIA
jgi:putative ABC transport system ATP-binding protein